MKISLLAFFALVLIQAIISGSQADVPPNHPSQLQYEQNGEASAKSASIAALATGRIPRQSRCIRCTYPYEDRYGGGGNSIGNRGYADDYYGRQYGSNRYYYDSAAASRGGYDDRNWYYYPERYDDRLNRYPDRYGSSALNVVEPTAPKKYDDRYASRTYDRYDAPAMGYYDRYNDYRGNGYDNRDYYRGGDSTYNYRDHSSYDRYRGAAAAAGGGYGGFEGRYNDRDTYYRAPFDYRNYRPWDDTYSGQSDYDNSGRGYYHGSRPDDLPPRPLSSFHYRPAPPPPPYSRPEDERNSYPPRPPSSRPYSPHASSRPHRPDSPSNPGSSSRNPGDSAAPPSQTASGGGSSSSLPSSQSASGSTSGSGSTGSSASSSHHYQYSDGPGRPDDDPNRGYAGHWTYLNDREKDAGYHPDNIRDRDREADRNRDRDMSGGREKDPESTAYGAHPRPLGGAYLLDRDTNSPVAVSGENKDNKMEDQTKVSAIEASNDGINGGGSGGSSLVGTSSASSSSGDNNKN